MTGTIRWQGAFDHVIAAFGRRPVAKLDSEVRDILRSGIFQLLHLDRVPASAVVNDAVTLTKKAGKKSAAPFVNALLRRVAREREQLPLPPRPDPAAGRDAQLDYLSVALSHPRWLAARWLDRYGFEATEAWLQFNNQPAAAHAASQSSARRRRTVVAASLAGHGVSVARGRFAPDALVVWSGNPLLTPIADSGDFLVQDEASQLVACLVGARSGQRVLDACASPGGKTTAIAAAMNDSGLIVATDVRGRRVDLLARTVRQSGAKSIRIVQADASALPFDPRVRLDSPRRSLLRPGDAAAGSRRQVAAFGERSPRLAAAQQQLLAETATVLRPGGTLVYSTCSSEPEENEDVVAKFVSGGGFRPVAPVDLPPPVQPLVNTAGHLRTFPFRDGLEAFFGAILRKAD